MPAFLARRRASPGGAAGRGGLSARRRSEGRRGVVVALVSTAVVFTGLGFAIVNAPGWRQIQRQFFDRHEFTSTFPEIASVHPSQNAAARSLGLSHGQSLRYVVLPQAVRRVIPPLLNDFIGLQKDTALVGVLGSIEAFKQTQIDQAASFNFTSGLVAAVLFVAITIPLTRLTDLLVARDRRRRQAAGVAV